MVIGDAKSDKRSSLTTKTPQPQKGTDNCVYEENFIFEYAERDDELKDWLRSNLPLAMILAWVRGDADLMVINGYSRRPSKIIHTVLDEFGLKVRITFGIANSVIIQIRSDCHAAVTGLGGKMCDAALNDLVHHSNEETQLERDDIIDCISREGDENILLSANVDQIKEVAEDIFGYSVPKKLAEKLKKKKEKFIKSPDFSYCPRYRSMWSRFTGRQLVSSVFGEASSSDSAKGVFDALFFVAGTNQTDLSVSASLKLGKTNGQKGLKSMTVHLFDMTAGRLLELSQNTDSGRDRCVLRAVAKLKAQEQLEALHLLKRVINLDEITPVTLEEVRSEIFQDSGITAEDGIFTYAFIDSAKRSAEIYSVLQKSVDRTIAHYENIAGQVPEEFLDDMEERILRLVATHSSNVTVARMGDGSLKTNPPGGISFPTVAFSGLLPNGDGTSTLSANALSALFKDISGIIDRNLHEIVYFYQLDSIEDIDKDSLEACARAIFPSFEDPVEQLKSLFSSKRKRSPPRVELQYLTKEALIRIGSKHLKVPSDVSESLALAYAVDSIWEDRWQKERECDVKRMRSSNSGTGETGHVEQSDSVGSSGTSTERPEQGPSTVAEVLKNMPGTKKKRKRVKNLLSRKGLERLIEQDTIALLGLERLLREHIYVIKGIFSVSAEYVVEHLRARGAQ